MSSRYASRMLTSTWKHCCPIFSWVTGLYTVQRCTKDGSIVDYFASACCLGSTNFLSAVLSHHDSDERSCWAMITIADINDIHHENGREKWSCCESVCWNAFKCETMHSVLKPMSHYCMQRLDTVYLSFSCSEIFEIFLKWSWATSRKSP